MRTIRRSSSLGRLWLVEGLEAGWSLWVAGGGVSAVVVSAAGGVEVERVTKGKGAGCAADHMGVVVGPAVDEVSELVARTWSAVSVPHEGEAQHVDGFREAVSLKPGRHRNPRIVGLASLF